MHAQELVRVVEQGVLDLNASRRQGEDVKRVLTHRKEQYNKLLKRLTIGPCHNPLRAHFHKGRCPLEKLFIFLVGAYRCVGEDNEKPQDAACDE